MTSSIPAQMFPEGAGTNGLQEPRQSIPIYVGNMSVQHVVGKPIADPNNIPADERTLERMNAAGAFAAVDYLAWRFAEKKKGRWDFSPYEANADFMHANGKLYSPFSWLHFPPEWYFETGRFVPYTNLQTGATIPQISLWSPDVERIYDEFYAEMAERMGDSISFIRLAMPSEYGEIGYCAGYTGWLIPQPHAGPGFWCGDEYARRDFIKYALKRYGSLKGVNQAWGTHFASRQEITMPLPQDWGKYAENMQSRRYWWDFLDWYDGSMERVLRSLVAVVRRHYPDTFLIGSLGYAAERPTYGNDQSRYLKAASELNMTFQSPTNVGHFAPRRVASASRFYDVPYLTEPPGVMTRDQVLDRIFIEISNGTDVWFDYLGNLEAGADYLEQYKHLLDSKDPVIKVALWHPSVDLRMDPANRNWSLPTSDIAEALRDAIDYHVVDDRMIQDGALEAMGIDTLILAGAQWLDPNAWNTVEAWVRHGGHFIIGQAEGMRSVAGGEDLMAQSFAGVAEPLLPSAKQNAQALQGQQPEQSIQAGLKAFGQGSVFVYDAASLTPVQRAELIGAVAEWCRRQAGDGPVSAMRLPPLVDGLFQADFGDYIVVYNTGQEAKTIELPGYGRQELPGRSIHRFELKNTL